MNGLIFFLAFCFSINSYANYKCNKKLQSKVIKSFDLTKNIKLVDCLYIPAMGKLLAIAEVPREGALSLFVYEVDSSHQLSEVISSVEGFAVDGMKEVQTSGLGILVKDGFAFYYREKTKDGVLVLQFKNENEYSDVSILLLDSFGNLKNINAHPEEVESMEVAETENMDLYIFKVENGATFDFVPWSEKVIIGSSVQSQFRQEFFFNQQKRLPAGLGVPSK